MSKDIRVYLEDTISAIEKIEGFVARMIFEEFAAYEKTQYAVVRAM